MRGFAAQGASWVCFVSPRASSSVAVSERGDAPRSSCCSFIGIFRRSSTLLRSLTATSCTGHAVAQTAQTAPECTPRHSKTENAGFHIEKSEQAAEAIDGQVNIPAL